MYIKKRERERERGGGEFKQAHMKKYGKQTKQRLVTHSLVYLYCYVYTVNKYTFYVQDVIKIYKIIFFSHEIFNQLITYIFLLYKIKCTQSYFIS